MRRRLDQGLRRIVRFVRQACAEAEAKGQSWQSAMNGLRRRARSLATAACQIELVRPSDPGKDAPATTIFHQVRADLALEWGVVAGMLPAWNVVTARGCFAHAAEREPHG